MGFHQCITHCDTLNDCKFVSYGNEDWGNKECRAYKSCNKTSSGHSIVTTYSKDGKCPGN